MKYQTTRTVDELGRVALPKELREDLNLDEGDVISIRRMADAIILQLKEKRGNAQDMVPQASQGLQ